MKKILYIVILTLSLVSCGDAGDGFYSVPELAEVNSLMLKEPATALQKLRSIEKEDLKNQLSNIEYNVLLAEALYKNYLPQSNFEELRHAVEVLELGVRNEELGVGSKGDFLCAKAHYYHAVGLTERDDVVGACTHYLRALEVMESSHTTLCRRATYDYEESYFMSLLYSRIGELFLGENYVDIALKNFRHALEYVEPSDNNSKSFILKYIGNTFALKTDDDSSLYYLKKSLEISPNPINDLDLEKSIARILYNKGEKDSAYMLLKNNLEKIEDYDYKHSYYALLGEFYYNDNEYDTAVHYLEKGFESQSFYTKVYAARLLSAINDSIGDYEKKVFYDELVSELTVGKVNHTAHNAKIQDVYYGYDKKQYDADENIKKNYYCPIKVKPSQTSKARLLIINSRVFFMRYTSPPNQKQTVEEADFHPSSTFLPSLFQDC